MTDESNPNAEQAHLAGVLRPTLNLASDMAAHEATERGLAARYPDPLQPSVLVSIDIESLALGPRPVITEIAMLGYDLAEDVTVEPRHCHHYPIEPQMRLIPAREIHVGTLIARADWTLTKGINFAEQLRLSSATEFEDLASLCRNLITVFNQITDSGKLSYEVVCARPQFDIVAIESLLKEVGLDTPWSYDSIIDVRTMLKRAGINHKNVPMPSGVIPHTAFGDARWQISQYLAAVRGVR